MIDFTVENALDQHLLRTEEPRLPDGMFHPSALFGCDRKAVYSVRGVPATDPPEKRMRRVFRIGHILHETVQTAVEKDGGAISTWSEIPVEIPQFFVRGSGDQLVQHAPEDYELLEYKSINDMAFRYKDLPKPEHIGQVRTYAYGLRHEGSAGLFGPLGESLRKVRLIYFSKNDLYIEEFPFLVSKSWEGEFEDRMARLGLFRNEGALELPPRLPLEISKKKADKGKLVKPWMCGYCEWRTRCWAQDGEETQVA